MKVTRRCPISGRINTRDIPVTQDQVERWYNGELIQMAMPELSADDREFLMTGITPEVWDNAFSEQE